MLCSVVNQHFSDISIMHALKDWLPQGPECSVNSPVLFWFAFSQAAGEKAELCGCESSWIGCFPWRFVCVQWRC